MFLALPFSCAKEEILAQTENPTATALEKGTDQATDFIYPDDNTVKTLDPDPAEDCQCYLQVVSVTGNSGTGGPSDYWELLYDPPYGTEVITGFDQTWKDIDQGVLKPLPSEFITLSPSYESGEHHDFYVYYSGDPMIYTNFTINTRVLCQELGAPPPREPDPTNGNDPMTETFHSFNITEANEPCYIYGGFCFWNYRFSCYYLTSDDDPPKAP